MKTGSIVLTEAMSAQEFASAAGKLKGGLWRYSKQEEIENGVMVVSLTKRSVVDSIKAALKPKDSLAAKHVIASLNARFGTPPKSARASFSRSSSRRPGISSRPQHSLH